MSRKKMRVSEHGYLRYAERVLGFDREQVHAELLRLIGGAVEVCPNCRVPFTIAGQEFVAVVRNRTVLTVVSRQETVPPPKPKRPKALRPMKDEDTFERLLAR